MFYLLRGRRNAGKGLLLFHIRMMKALRSAAVVHFDISVQPGESKFFYESGKMCLHRVEQGPGGVNRKGGFVQELSCRLISTDYRGRLDSVSRKA
ncbi:MAG: hypothetical protein D3906_18065 [Candidatus Electrothrix sp. AUS1_2]|nr:hypothetical protein [Candidatus Electrothrix sp. AUS1_2]